MKKLFLLSALAALLGSCSSEIGSKDAVSPGTGIGGSMARFTVAGNTLYRVGTNNLQAYDISSAADPKPGQNIPLNFGVETIFPYRNNLFIGTQTGMYIFDISQPNAPRQLSFYSHFVSCDPVVAQGNYAYVTLRSGTTCRNNNLNSLDVVDIRNLSAPRLVKSYPMRNPHGLGVDGNLLFVCEGDFGLKVLDITDPENVREIRFLEDIQSYDVIPARNILIVTGKGGISQYSYTEAGSLKLLSSLAVEK
ncbi:LVIVD repeat-containing protein [Tellurirhabdus rosea]|uniref:LVIVD repeat-containing protein n=1 Tax=Tellurirhabdus rosea TaxID=2674997 RepID=UPI002258880F|nr:hypothetical protein [Tellurirhabdus rosea]